MRPQWHPLTAKHTLMRQHLQHTTCAAVLPLLPVLLPLLLLILLLLSLLLHGRITDTHDFVKRLS